MRVGLYMTAIALLTGTIALLGADLTPAVILQKTSERYKSLQTYDIKAETRVSITQNGAMGGGQGDGRLTVGANGTFRVESSSSGEPEVSVSDGKITWKSLPGKKVWSKQKVAQITSADDDSEEEQQAFAGQDLFSQTQRSFVTRYIGLGRYANEAELEKTEKVKINGSKVECYVIRLATKGSKHKIYIARDSFLVARHIEVQPRGNGEVVFLTEYKTISLGTPANAVFEFDPPSGSKEVADVMLPSERNMSLVGKAAVDFTLKNLDGTPVHLSELRGKIVLLDFWATWCPPCRHELPSIESISKKYSDRNVTVLGVNDEESSTAKRFLAKYHPDLQTLHDAGGKVHHIYGCNAIPTVLIINPEGKIVAHYVGERQETELVAALKQAGMN